VFFVRDAAARRPDLLWKLPQAATTAYREFIIGNEIDGRRMVARQRQEIRDRLEADLALRAKRSSTASDPCPEREDVASWNVEVVCSWSYGPSAMPQVFRAQCLSRPALAIAEPLAYLPRGPAAGPP